MSTLAPGLPLSSPVPFRPSRKSLILAWLPTFFWMGVIAFESTAIFTSEHTESWLFSLLKTLFGLRFALAHSMVLNEYGRKLGHFTGYGILSLLAFFGWSAMLVYHQQLFLAGKGKAVAIARRWHLRAAALAVLLTFVVASCDELHQAFIPGRTATFHDVMLDTLGGIFAQILILLFWKPKTPKQLAPEPVLAGAGSANRA